MKTDTAKRASDPIAAAGTRYLWPYLSRTGFGKVTQRKYARVRNDVVQQLWIDANGSGGKSRTRVILCVHFIFGDLDGYMDPHGFIICGGKSWNMSTSDSADHAMQLVVAALEQTEMKRLDELSSPEAMLRALAAFSRRADWHREYSTLWDRWQRTDADLLRKAERNRVALGLAKSASSSQLADPDRRD